MIPAFDVYIGTFRPTWIEPEPKKSLRGISADQMASRRAYCDIANYVQADISLSFFLLFFFFC